MTPEKTTKIKRTSESDLRISSDSFSKPTELIEDALLSYLMKVTEKEMNIPLLKSKMLLNKYMRG